MSVVMMPRGDRESWTDERLDDLNHKVDEGFSDMREEFRAMRGEAGANHRTLIQLISVMWVTCLVGFLGVIASIVTSV
jgi:hypothetical protein